ncbi:hypothetical protein TCAL_15583 [Tigriopus californicus]|uniref:DNA-directed RNA polymerase I subunit RPA34 n=1 Tax=Tigriopus californicus TaxID=6832 RepID=A0A553PDN2_TIGCA|nr:hypothetical protein TCAL_15583 [Tigriopus californicus]
MPKAHPLSASEAEEDDEAPPRIKSKGSTALTSLEELTNQEQNDVWLVRIPSSIKPDSLHDQLLLQNGEVKLERKGAKFVNKTSKKKSSVNVVTLNWKGLPVLTNVPLRGEVTFNEEVEFEPDFSCQRIPNPKEVVQPSIIKERHPLFGFQSPPDVHTEEEELIENAATEPSASPKKYKRKSKSKTITEITPKEESKRKKKKLH